MTFFSRYRKDIYQLLWVYAAFIAARVLFIWLMPATYSKDLYAWLQVIDVLKNGGNPYSVTDVLNWPPFWMQLLYGIHAVSKFSGVSPTHLIQATLIIGEAITIFPCYIILRQFFNIEKPAGVLIAGLALNPISILLSCQHCNFDVFVGFWIVLTIWALLSFYKSQSPVNWLMACFFLGMGILTKTIPLILTPLLVVGVRRQQLSTILFGMLLLFTPIIIGMSIIFALGHAGVINNVIEYRSMAGWYGVTGILGLLDAGALTEWYKHLSPVIILTVLVYLTVRYYRKDTLRPELLLTIALCLLISLPTLGPGYSPPYINWFLPLLIILYGISGKRMRHFLLAGYIIVAATYITEYACFDSHGAFLVKFFPSDKMNHLSDVMGARQSQVLIRMPMFAYYLSLLWVLIKKTLNSSPVVPIQL